MRRIRPVVASLFLLTAASLALAAPRRDATIRAHEAATPAVEASGALDAYLQAPPPTAEEALAQRLVQMGATQDAAWEAVAALAPWQVAAQSGDGSVVAAELGAATVANIGVREDRLAKAAQLAEAYLLGRPVSLEGVDIPESLRARIGDLQAEGVGPEMAAWLARQELAASQSSIDAALRLDASLALLDVDDDVRARLSAALIGAAAGGVADGNERVVFGGSGADIPPAVPNAACSSCPNYQYGTFIPTQNWATHLSSIGFNDCRVYRFSLTAGKTYRFTLCEGGGTANFSAAIESSSYQSQVCAVGPNGIACGGSLSMLDYTPTYTGFFFVKVRNLNMAGAGYSFRLAYRDTTPQCLSCPASNFGPLVPSPAYQTHSSSIGPLECRVYKFSVTANKTYRFTLCPTDSSGVASGASSAFAATLTARNASCALIGAAAPAPCNPGEEIDVTPTGTTIYVEVRGDSIADVGAYTLAYRDLARCANCPASDFGPFVPTTTYQTHASSIAADKCKLYKFNVVAGKTYRFTTAVFDCDGSLTGGSTNFDAVLEAYNSACAFLGSADDNGCFPGAEELDITPAYSGALYVRVKGFSPSDSGTYGLAYRDTEGFCRRCSSYDAAAPPPALAYQTMPASNVELNGGCRIYRFFLTVGNAYRFTFCDPDSAGITSGAFATFDTVLEMMNPSCTVVASDDDTCGLSSELDFTPTVTGFHYLRVRGFSGADAGPFALAYRQFAGACKSCPGFDYGPFTPGQYWQTHAASVVSEACRVHKFALVAGNDYEFSLCDGGGSSTFMFAYAGSDASCGAIGGASPCEASGGSDSFTISATSSGAHYVSISGVDPSQWGSYVLAWRNRTAACGTSCAAGTFNHGPFTPQIPVNFHSDSVESSCTKTYAFNVVTGGSYHFWLCPPGGAAFDSSLSGEDDTCAPAGTLTPDACGDDDTLDFVATYTGLYHVTVSVSAGSGGAYTLAYWHDPEDPANGNCHDGFDNDADGLADVADPDCQCGGDFTITVSGAGFMDETTWTLTSSSGGALLGAGGPYAFASNNVHVVTVADADAPVDFDISTFGTFNDNVADWSVSCNGAVLASGTVLGGSADGASDLCCH